MKLLDKPLSIKDQEYIISMLDGNICRIMVSDDPEEIMYSLGFAVDRISMLAYSRVKEIKTRNKAD